MSGGIPLLERSVLPPHPQLPRTFKRDFILDLHRAFDRCAFMGERAMCAKTFPSEKFLVLPFFKKVAKAPNTSYLQEWYIITELRRKDVIFLA